MPEDNITGRDDQQQGTASEAGRYTFSTVDEAAKIIEALSKRVDEQKASAAKYAETSRELSDRLRAIESAQQKRLEEQGNYAEIAKQRAAEVESLKPAAERAVALEAIIRESNEEAIKRVPESMRSMIPTDYAPEKLQRWLAMNTALLTKTPPPDFGAGAGTSGGSKATPLTDEQRQMAKRFGMTEEQYAKQLAKGQG